MKSSTEARENNLDKGSDCPEMLYSLTDQSGNQTEAASAD